MATPVSETKRTFCRICEPACGLVATVEDGRLTALAPDKTHPVTRGYACHKGLHALHIHHDPDRLDHPLARTAQGLEQVEWSAALDGIASRLRALIARHGPEAVGGYLGNPGAYNSQLAEPWYGFFGQLGVQRLFNAGTQDCANKFAGAEAVYGSVTIQPIPDFEHTDFLLLLGENPKVSQMSFCSIADPVGVLKGIAARGGRVVLVNPRRVETLTHVGELFQVRPDSDVYLLAAMLHVIDRDGGFDAAVVGRHARGVDRLRSFVADWSPARVAGVVGVPAEDITRLARDFRAANRASLHMSTGVNMGRQGTLAFWLGQMLVLLTGNLDVPGGNVLSVGYYTRHARAGRRPAEGPVFVDSPFGPYRSPRPPVFPLPGNLLADFITRAENPLRALVVCAGNPVLSMAGETRLQEALSRLELLVVIDLYPNASAEHAHYLLPATDAFERADVNSLALGLQHRPSVQYTDAVVAPMAGRRHERWVLQQLAARMGLEAGPEDPGPRERFAKVAHMLGTRGADFETLRAEGVIDFGSHQPGNFYTQHLQTEDQRVDCYPAHFEPALSRMDAIFEELSAATGPLVLISRREARSMNSWFANVPVLRRGAHTSNPVHMHPQDAVARGLADGASVVVQSAAGRIEAQLALSDDLRPGVVAMAHGWGHGGNARLRVAQAAAGVNVNRLLPSGPGSFEPLSGQAHMTGIPVDVLPA